MPPDRRRERDIWHARFRLPRARFPPTTNARGPGGLRCTVLCFPRQESAPTDVSGLINSIYARMNEDLDDVLKLEINYVGGVIHRYGDFEPVESTTADDQNANDSADTSPPRCASSRHGACQLLRIRS